MEKSHCLAILLLIFGFAAAANAYVRGTEPDGREASPVVESVKVVGQNQESNEVYAQSTLEESKPLYDPYTEMVNCGENNNRVKRERMMTPPEKGAIGQQATRNLNVARQTNEPTRQRAEAREAARRAMNQNVRLAEEIENHWNRRDQNRH